MPRISLVFASGLHDFFNSGTWQVIRNLALLFVAIFWAATAYWVYKDARRRIEDPWLVAMATLLGAIARSRSRRWRSASRGATSTARCAGPRSTRPSSSARSARRGSSRPARAARRRSRRCGRSARTARRRSSLPRRWSCRRSRRRAGSAAETRSSRVATERTLVLIKPDAMRRGLAGEILARLEQRGLVLRGADLVHVDRDLAEQHYAEHREKAFFEELVEFITSSPTLALAVEGEGAIALVRTTVGATDPANAAPGTIRGDLALSMPDNLVHGSDSPESAARELALWFPDLD